MQRCKELDQLRDSIHALLKGEGDNNQGELSSLHAGTSVCAAVEACLSHGLKRVSATETVSLWGLLQWTNVSQLERHRAWKLRQEKLEAKEQSKDWYLNMFKEELQQISTLTVHTDNPVANDADVNPLTPGFHASIRIVNSLLHVSTPHGRVRAWIRHCCNTHLLSSCLAAVMHPQNQAALRTYFTPGALCCDADMREVLVGLTSTLDRLQFGFCIDSPDWDRGNASEIPVGPLPQQSQTPPKPCFITNAHPSPSLDATADSGLFSEATCPSDATNLLHDVLDTTTQALHQLLRDTPPAILTARTDEVGGPAAMTIFGVPLAALVSSPATCDVALLDCMMGVPNLVEGCCRLIDAAATTCTPALFASKVHKARFAQLIAQVERTGTLSVWTNVHHSIVILIKWLRDLPEPLIPPHLHAHCMAVVDMPGDALPIMELRNVVHQLHWSAKPTLLRLCATLTRVVQSKAGTTVEGLSGIFGRILFEPTTCFTALSAQAKVVQLLLTHSTQVLEPISREVVARRQALTRKLRAIQAISHDLHEPLAPITTHAALWASLQRSYPAVTSPDHLRGGGVLAAACLVYFADEHAELATQLIAQRVLGHRKQYPLPVASVHIVRMLVSLLHLTDATTSADVSPVVDFDVDAWFARCDGNDVDGGGSPIAIPSALALVQQGLWRLFDDHDAFYRLFGWSLLVFDRNYTRSGATCMDFSTILAETQLQVTAHLQQHPASIPHLYQLWADSLESQAVAAPKASAHMRTYVVVWEGGVTVRGYPSKQADVIATRDEGDVVDTVLQAGNWLKLRDLPGGQGGGWVLSKTDRTTLLQLVDPTQAV
ncbi:hypothetical protein H310_09466 [Aphanomyces invadans]|uniref:RUN domain-containing protein n=1 Tax=Aphanomyces invadans TaxID=157072 RepID=A0A024TVA5_9STRA|nr:hypothetical protein H310_09466 [Aphanomyces invadans]ETV97561.1 hypothetical protein H310_09466 [Aphanomyces invadans]|eukprot:XP_008873770.1 hypothetical protein H310_09466 [Aphanomyces invadans]